MNSITFARFAGERTLAVAGYLWQWDYGQVLKIEGLELPTEYEVHFSNTSETGTTVTVLGDKNGVNIPDALLETGNPIFAFIYLHDLETDGETEYKIKIPVRKRPHPDRVEPSPEQTDLITQAITALNQAVERTDASTEEASEAAELAQQAAATFKTDPTLTIEGMAADAKAVGDRFANYGFSIIDGKLCVTYAKEVNA